MASPLSYNDRMNMNHPVWSSSTQIDSLAAGSTTTSVAKSGYMIVDNQSGGLLTIAPTGTTTGILLSPGDSFSVAVGPNAVFDFINAGGSPAVVVWLT